jgi:type I restriction enzyme M protein
MKILDNKEIHSIVHLKQYISVQEDTLMKKFCHSFHNDVRNKTKLNDSDKPLFISAILLSLIDETFSDLIKKDKLTDGCMLSDVMINIITKIDSKKNFIDSFKFIKMCLDNELLFDFCKKIYSNLSSKSSHLTSDILNLFYSEFVKYSNTDSKSLGIVLTPDHIVKLMVDLIDINSKDKVLDLCAGSGSFLCECIKRNPKKIYCCEYQSNLYTLTKTNIILRNYKRYEIFNKDCFKCNFSKQKITKSLINPPYGTRPKCELDFIIKQLESVEEKGLITAIVPIGIFNNNTFNNEKKKEILSQGRVLTIIKCNKKLFSDVASIETCIIVIEKNKDGHSGNVSYLNYEDDALEVKIRAGRVKTNEFDDKYNKVLQQHRNREYPINISFNSDWINSDLVVPKYINKLEFEKEKLDKEYKQKMEELDLRIKNNLDEDLIKYKKEKTFRIGELFEFIKKPNEKYQGKEMVPVVCASKFNLGIKKYEQATEKDTFTGNKLVAVTGGDGAGGIVHYHISPFKITSSTIVLIPKYEFLNENNGTFISKILSKYKVKYSHSFQWNRKRLEEDTITLPINDKDEIEIPLFV